MQRRFKIVVGVSASENADAVVEYALDQAARHEHSALHLLAVVPDDSFEAAELARHHLEELTRTKLDVFSTRDGASRRLHVHVRTGDRGEQLVELAHEVEADLLVVGAGTAATGKPHIAHVAQYVLDNAPCVCMLVRVVDYGQHPMRDKQCADCAVVRSETDGERWFCEAHSGRKTMTSALFHSFTEPSLRGGPML